MRKRTTILHWPPIRKESSTRPAQSSRRRTDRKSTRLNSSHDQISYAVFCLKKKKKHKAIKPLTTKTLRKEHNTDLSQTPSTFTGTHHTPTVCSRHRHHREYHMPTPYVSSR